MSVRRILSFVLFFAASAASPAEAAKPVLSGEYKLPASFDAEVTTDLETEEWAKVWRPASDGLYPLVIFLHGNHGTCGRYDAQHGVRIDDSIDYTYTGTCPDGYVVTPNHAGYDYLAQDLAKRGYVVVSINANRGINGADGVAGDDGLNLRRGRLILRHLEYLAQWNASGGAPDSLGFQLTGILDFAHVGLMGHSRGGEGVRAAVAQYKDKGSPWPARIGKVKFEAMFEIGPVDGQTSRVLDNTGMDWNVLLPGCDGDVYDLEGLKPFDRSLLITNEKKPLAKSSFEVFGANHNFYNTEWQLSDADSCDGETPLFTPYLGSQAQRTTAHDSLIPFFLARLGRGTRAKGALIFDPSYPLPASLASVTRYARGFTAAPRASENFIIDNFDKATGTSSEGVADQSAGLTQYLHGTASRSDAASQRAAHVNWNAAGGFLQVNAAAPGNSVDASAYQTLEFRVALRCFATLCNADPDPAGDVDFSIALANGDGSLSSPVRLKDVAAVYRPAGVSGIDNSIFQTVRVPASDFAGADPSHLRGVRFTFDRTSASSIYLANVRFTRAPAGPGGLSGAALRAAGVAAAPAIADDNRIVAVRLSSSGAGEIELYSSRPFPVTDALPTLIVGTRSYTLSRFVRGDMHRMIFSVDAAPKGAEVALRIGGRPVWTFGRL